MRALLMLLAVMLPLAAAQAGTRAVYRMDDGKRLLIEATDTGEARVQEVGSADYGVLKGDGFYMVGTEGGALQVARIEDIAAAMDKVVPPIFKGIFGAAGSAIAPAKLRVEAKGARTVAGFPGKEFAVYGLDDSNPAKAETFVISSDPKLAPVGRAMEGFMNAAVVPAAVLIGPGIRDLIAQTRAIFALGTPLDAGGRFALESAETATIGGERTELPAKPQSVAEIEAAFRRSMAQPQQAEPAK